jgi:antitoxin HicB
VIYKVPLVLSPQSEGGFSVTSPLLPESVTEGDTIEEVLDNVRDALEATIEAYQDLGRPVPKNVPISESIQNRRK